MRSLVMFLVVSAALCVGAGCWLAGPTVPVVTFEQQLAKAELQCFWDFRLPLHAGEKIARLYLLDENLYCLTSDNRLVAIDAMVGRVLWSQEVADVGKTVFAPRHYDGIVLSKTPATMEQLLKRGEHSGESAPFDVVFVTTITRAKAFDRRKGELIRTLPFTFGPGASASAVSDGRYLFVTDNRGYYHAVRLHEGLRIWTMLIGDMIMAPPAYSNDRLYVANAAGVVHAVSASQTRQKIWSRRLDGPVTAAMLVDRQGCFVPCEDRRLYALDPVSGRQLWDPLDCDRPLRDAPQASDVSVFQYARGGSFYAVNRANGTLRWKKTGPRKVLAVVDNDVYLVDNRRRLLIVDEILGKVKASVELGGMQLFAANTTAPGIYLAKRSGQIYCLRPLSAGRLTAEMIRQAGK